MIKNKKNVIYQKMISTPVFKLSNGEGIDFLNKISKNSVDLVLTDPPYIISQKSGMQAFFEKVNANEKNTKTDEEWEEFKKKNNLKDDSKKKEFVKYGTIYGKKYAVRTDYGSWDKDFDMEQLNYFVKEYFRVLKNGGTCIIFFDLWKISLLHDMMKEAGFKQLRMIEWIKTNPQPRNSRVNYLTNCREIAVLGVKKSKPTFNSKYDNGIYHYPLQGGKGRIHPTQKSLALFEELIRKHSNENDVVLDTFLGAGTTAIACKNTNRICMGCERQSKYFDTYYTSLGIKVNKQ
jgi:site-specific DNA-methyltransferase (adenine-specific)